MAHSTDSDLIDFLKFLLISSQVIDSITLHHFSDLHSTIECVSYTFMNGRWSYKLLMVSFSS